MKMYVVDEHNLLYLNLHPIFERMNDTKYPRLATTAKSFTTKKIKIKNRVT